MLKAILSLLIVLIAVPVMASEIVVNFSYPEEATGYTLYMEGTEICKIQEAAQGEQDLIMTCGDLSIEPGWHSFTMTAGIPERGGFSAHESRHSVAVSHFVPYQAECRPTVITIIINGSEVTLGGE